MPAKKAASSRAQSSDMGMGSIWKWVYLIGLVVAGLVAAFNFTMADPYLGWLLLLAAILSGIFFLDSGDVVNFGIRVLLFFAVLKGLRLDPHGWSLPDRLLQRRLGIPRSRGPDPVGRIFLEEVLRQHDVVTAESKKPPTGGFLIS